MRNWIFCFIHLMAILLFESGCKKASNSVNQPNVVCNIAQSFKIAYNGSTMPDEETMQGDTINFQADISIPGKYVHYDYRPNALAGCEIVWDFGDGSISTSLSPNHVYNSNQTYTIHLMLNHDSANIISSSIYVGPTPIYTQLITGAHQWKCTRVTTDGPTNVSNTTIIDTAFIIHMINNKTILIDSAYLNYIPGYSKIDTAVYMSYGGDPMCTLVFRHLTNKIQCTVFYGWWMTDTFESM